MGPYMYLIMCHLLPQTSYFLHSKIKAVSICECLCEVLRALKEEEYVESVTLMSKHVLFSFKLHIFNVFLL